MAKRVVVEFAGETKNLDKAFARVQQSAGGLDKALKGLAGAAAVGVITDQIGKSIDAASDLDEALNRSNMVFGQSGDVISTWAAGAAEDFGLSQRAALDAAGSFGNMFTQLGVGSADAAAVSQQMTELAADFASFHNADITQVIQAQSSAFRGEYDALQRFLPTISAATVEQKALEMTGKTLTKQLNAEEKAAAVVALMMAGAGDAAGDFDRTSGSLANQQRSLTAEMEDLRAEIGQDLLPVMVQLAGFAKDTLIPNFQAFLGLGSDFDNFGGALRDAIGDAMGFVLGALQQAARGIANVISALPTDLGEGIAGRLREAADEMDVYRDRLHASGEELFGHANREKEAGKATGGHTKEVKANTGAVKDNTKAVDDAKEARFDLRDANLSLADSQDDAAAAQKAYDDFVRTGITDLEDYAAATRDLASANDEVTAATNDVLEAQLAVNEALKPATQDEWLSQSDKEARARNDLTIAELDAADAMDEYSRMVQTGTATEDELTRAWVKADEAARDVTAAQRTLNTVLGEGTALGQKGTTQTDTYKTAVANLATADAALLTATTNQTTAQAALNATILTGQGYADHLETLTRDLEKANLDLDKATWGVVTAQRELTTAVQATRTAVRDLWGDIIGLGEDLPILETAVSGVGTLRTFNPTGRAIPGLASGGPVTAGMSYVVGEAGPELFVPSRSGQIVPNGVGGGGIVVNVSGALDPASVARQIQSLLLQEQRRSGGLGFNN
jgi:hypothetical protein